MPGFTSTSQVPQMFAAAGTSYVELVDLLVQDVLEGRSASAEVQAVVALPPASTRASPSGPAARHLRWTTSLRSSVRLRSCTLPP
jgi:hypothetical protein